MVDSSSPKAIGANCHVCPFLHFDHISPETSATAIFAVVGDCPSTSELRENRPFGGLGGQALTRLFASHGIQRDQIHWTHTLLCSHPSLSMSSFLRKLRHDNKERRKAHQAGTKGDSSVPALIPTPQECCAPRLERELASFSKIVVCGREAAKAVIHYSASLMSLRGSPLSLDRSGTDGKVEQIQIFPTFSPSMVLHAPKWTSVFIQDIQRVVRWFTTDSLAWKPPQIFFNPSSDQLQTFLAQAQNTYLAYDVETDGIESLTSNLRCIGIGTPDQVVVVGMLSIDGKDRFYSSSELGKIILILKNFFEDPTILKVGHNAGYYDRLVMRQQLDIEVHPTLDTMLLHRLVASNLPHNLGFVASVYTDAPSWKTTRDGKKKAYGSETDQELHEYCAYDVAITAALLPPLNQAVKERNQQPLSVVDHQVQLICGDMHSTGLYVDQEERYRWQKSLVKSMVSHVAAVRNHVGKNVNPASSSQIRNLLFEEWGLDPLKFTPHGEPATSENVLRSLLAMRSLSPLQRQVINHIRLYRQATRLLGTFVTKLKYTTQDAAGGNDDNDTSVEREHRDRYGLNKVGIVYADTNRMHPGYHCHVSTTGRVLSSSPYAVHQLPFPLRSMICAPPGHTFISVTFGDLELRVAATQWQLSPYLKAFEMGLDPHSSVSAYIMFGKRFVAAAKACGAGDYPWKQGTSFSDQAARLRNLAKTIQSLSMYGASAAVVQRFLTTFEHWSDCGSTALPYLSLSVREVRVLHEKWGEALGLESTWHRVRQTGEFVTEPILHRRLDIGEGDNPLDSLSFPIQGAATALLNLALIEVRNHIGVGRIVTQCQNSIVVECPVDAAPAISQILHACLSHLDLSFSLHIAHRFNEV